MTTPRMTVLAGDVGGTKTRLALYEYADGRLARRLEATFASDEFGGLEAVVGPFLAANPGRVDLAGFGVAGPVRHGVADATNLPWVVDARKLAVDLGLRWVALINDLEATAYGLAALDPDDLEVLNSGVGATGNRAVIAAGTGLGEAGLFWDGLIHRPFASEGGHGDFAPRDELEQALLTYLMRQYPDHVSYERVLSGPGLLNVYQFLRDTGRGEEPAWLAEAMRVGDASAAISQAALDGSAEISERALDLFVSIYGAEAGNLALKVMATGGLYVGGGIAPKIIAKLRDGTFMRAFTAKGRLRSLMEAVPVRVVLNDRAALLGAARAAVLAET